MKILVKDRSTTGSKKSPRDAEEFCASEQRDAKTNARGQSRCSEEVPQELNGRGFGERGRGVDWPTREEGGGGGEVKIVQCGVT